MSPHLTWLIRLLSAYETCTKSFTEIIMYTKQFPPPHVSPFQQWGLQMELNASLTSLPHWIYNGSTVVSGISARFPKSANIAYFQRNLLHGSDMTSEARKRWVVEKVPERFGFLDCLDKFDADFFNLIPRLAHQLDPQTRFLLETTFEAMADAGRRTTCL